MNSAPPRDCREWGSSCETRPPRLFVAMGRSVTVHPSERSGPSCAVRTFRRLYDVPTWCRSIVVTPAQTTYCAQAFVCRTSCAGARA